MTVARPTLRRALAALPVMLLVALPGSAPAQADPRVAVFDFELQDSSLEGQMNGPREDERGRLAEATELVRTLLTEMGAEVVDMAPVQDQLAQVGPIRLCNGCERRIAGEVDADYAVIGVVQKISNLILKFAIYVRDVQSGEVVDMGATDIRSNTSEAWKRGVDFIMEHRLSDSPLAQAAQETAQ